MKRAVSLAAHFVAIVILCSLTGCDKGGGNVKAPSDDEALAIVRSMIIDEINSQADTYAGYNVFKLGELHFVAIGENGVEQLEGSREWLVSACRKFYFLNVRYDLGQPGCVSVGKVSTRQGGSFCTISVAVPIYVAEVGDASGYAICDVLPDGIWSKSDEDMDAAIKAARGVLALRLPKIEGDYFRIVGKYGSETVRDVNRRTIRIQWDNNGKRWVPANAQGGNSARASHEINAKAATWTHLSDKSIETELKAKGFAEYGDVYATAKAVEFFENEKKGLSFHDGQWFIAGENAALNESLQAFLDAPGVAALDNLVRSLIKAQGASDALREQCKSVCTEKMCSTVTASMQAEKTTRDIGVAASFAKRWISDISTDEGWRELGLEKQVPILKELVERYYQDAQRDIQRLKALGASVTKMRTNGAQTDFAALTEALARVPRRAAYEEAWNNVQVYMSAWRACVSVRQNGQNQVNLAHMPKVALQRCQRCRGTGEKICQKCNGTRVCQICNGRGYRELQKLKGPEVAHSHSGNDRRPVERVACNPVCVECNTPSKRKCGPCNGTGTVVDWNLLNQSMIDLASSAESSIASLIYALSQVQQQ